MHININTHTVNVSFNNIFTIHVARICSGQTCTWHLFPVLSRVEVDTKERYKFFGGQRQRSCGIGSGPRVGRSVFRPCTPHATRKDDIDLKRELSVTGGAKGRAAAASLARRGIHPFISCPAILIDCKDAVLSLPGRMFGGLYAYDTMHTIFIGAIGYLLDAIVDLLTPSGLRELDKRSASFSCFRDPITGKTVRRVPRVSKLSFLTAEQRVVYLFTMAHAIGHRALLFPEAVRKDLLLAVTSLQIVCFVTRGKRPFTLAEHNYVFEVVGKQFWNSLAQLVSWKERVKAREVHRRNLNKPPAKRKRPRDFVPASRDPNESSDTVDSDGRDSLGPQHIVRSSKIIPHAFVHLADQVMLGGLHQFHNTSAVESNHRISIQLPGTRVRKYTAADETEVAMLDYTLDIHLFDNIASVVLELDQTEDDESSPSEGNKTRLSMLIKCI